MAAYSTGELCHLSTVRIRQCSRYSSRLFPASVALVNNYDDDGHLGYYGKINCGLKQEEKKRMKIVKGLERDLKCLNMVEHSDNGLVGEVKGQVISEAAEQLLSYLTKLRAEAKDLKKQRKQEKAKAKAEKKATKAKTCKESSSSSSSSSESSDGECETKALKASTLEKTDPGTTAALQTVNAPELEEAKCMKGTQVLRAMEKIEVCMGGKCKKAGADELKMEFEKMVGEEGVVGCKCMGKCRDGPNVRVRNESFEDGLLRVSKGLKIPDVRKEVRLKLHELSICLKKSDSLQKEKQGFKRSGPLVRCTKLSSQMVGKLRMSKSDVSSKRVAKITNIIARLYSSYPSEVVAVLLEFFKLQVPDFSNDDEMESSDDSDQDFCMDALCDVKAIISRLSRKKPGLILSILKTVLEMIEEWEYAQSKKDEIQTRKSGIDNLCSLVFWLLKNIKALKKSNKIRILDESQSVLSTNINASPHVSLTKLLHKILSLSVIGNKHLLKSASLLIEMIDDTALARKIMKIPLPKTEEQSNVNSTSPIEYNIEEASIKEEMEKLESLKLNIRKRKCESIDSGNGKLWNLAKSWIPCPMGMLPCSFSSTAVLPVMDKIEEASEDESVQVKNIETGMCTSDACENESVSKKLKVVEESEADTPMDMSGSMEGRLLIAGIWEKINEEELRNMETNIKIFIRF